MRVSDYVVKRLAQEGITNVFLVTGRGLLYLTDSIAANNSITPVSMHNEQAASYAAYAYASYNNHLGACMVSTGCASTNAITGVMCAWQDDLPVIVISGQNMLNETTYHTNSKIRSYGQQENNIIPMVKSITKYAVMVEKPQDIGFIMDKAINEAMTGRKGPVWIDIPLDIQSAQIDENVLIHYECPTKEELGIVNSVNDIIHNINESTRPVILIGSGVREKSFVDEFKDFVEYVKIPVVYDASAVDIYTNENEFSIGAVGSMSGTRAGNFAIQNSDYVLSIGCRLSTMLTGTERDKFARSAKITVVDIDENELQENCFRKMELVNVSPGRIITELWKSRKVISFRNDEWRKKCIHWKHLFPKNINIRYNNNEPIDMYEVAECVGRYLNNDVVAISDAGIEELVFPSTLCVKAGSRFIHPISQGAMGFAIPAIVGASYASNNDVICFVGDGSIMMNIQELQTIKHHNINPKIFVINNNCYSVIRSRQKELFRNRTIGTDSTDGVSLPEFSKVAMCFGYDYFIISKYDELANTISEVLTIDGPVICEIICKENQPFLKNAFAMNKRHRLLRRSLEDQAPFLERDVIISEMIIEPIEVE